VSAIAGGKFLPYLNSLPTMVILSGEAISPKEVVTPGRGSIAVY